MRKPTYLGHAVMPSNGERDKGKQKATPSYPFFPPIPPPLSRLPHPQNYPPFPQSYLPNPQLGPYSAVLPGSSNSSEGRQLKASSASSSSTYAHLRASTTGPKVAAISEVTAAPTFHSHPFPTSSASPILSLKRSASAASLTYNDRRDPPLPAAHYLDLASYKVSLSIAKRFPALPSQTFPSASDLDIKLAEAPFGESSTGDIIIIAQGGDTAYRIHEHKLSVTSRLFKESLEDFFPREWMGLLPLETFHGLPIFAFPYLDTTVCALVHICHNMHFPDFKSIEALSDFVKFCHHYHHKRWLWVLTTAEFRRFTASDPAECLKISLAGKWRVGISMAARSLQCLPQTDILPQLESRGLAEKYTEYLGRCIAAVQSAIVVSKDSLALPYFCQHENIAPDRFRYCPHAPSAKWETITMGQNGQELQVPEYVYRLCISIRERLSQCPTITVHVRRNILYTFKPEALRFCRNGPCRKTGMGVVSFFTDELQRNSEGRMSEVRVCVSSFIVLYSRLDVDFLPIG